MNVLQILAQDLTDARGHGEPFAQAWDAAHTHALTGVTPPRERQAWSDALNGTRATWARCYRHGAATPQDIAARRLTGALVTERDGFRRYGELVA